MALQPKTIDDYCRLCAIESQSGVIIYSTEGENLCLEEKIISCLRIEVSRDDLLPKKVCQLCSDLLEDYHRFSERAAQVQQTLGLLLGIHTPHVPSQEMQLCLMQTNVKVESNVIKNELDDLTIQHGSIQIDNQKFDLPLLSDEYANDTFAGREDFLYSPRELDDNVAVDSVRQMHRRKMTQPKKTALCDSFGREILSETGNCLITKTNEDDTDFKSETLNDCDFFPDLNSNEDVDFGESEIEKEWRKHWGIMCNQCMNVFSTRTLFDKHYQLYYNKEPVYTCSYCKVSLDKYSEYKSHCDKHIYEGKFKCEFCDKKFCKEGMLQAHLMTHNGRSESFVCEECGVEFSSQKTLKSHKKKHNTQIQREFPCPECGKILQTRGGLTAHLTVHKLGRRFMCHICGKTFTQKINMQQHVKHHRGEKPYSCQDCGKSFTEKSHLNRHKSFHTLDRPFQCPVCKKMYKTERCLKVHSHVHLNTRPYICSYCGKGFISSSKLKQHHNCHTGERPFACKYCDRTFTNYPNWLKHTRRRHKVDHKTGLSLKEESPIQEVPHKTESLTPDNGGIEFVEMPEVEMIEDGEEDSVQQVIIEDGLPMISQSSIIQFRDSMDLSNSQTHAIPGFTNPLNVNPVHLSPYFI